MKFKPNRLLIYLSLLSIAPFTVCQALSLEQLEQRCEKARADKIAPLQQEAIEECIARNTRRRNAEEHCQRFYRDFGAGGTTMPGGFRQRMFHDLPECLEFYEAEQQTRRRSR